MTFVPAQRQSIGAATTFRTVLFWVLVIALAVVLWQMASRNKNASTTPQMSYSDFMAQVDRSNIGAAHLYESPSTAEIQGQLREPPNQFRVTIPKETIPALTEQLRKQGVNIEVSQERTRSVTDVALDWGVLVVLIAVWITTMRRRTRGQQKMPPPDAPNRPIG